MKCRLSVSIQEHGIVVTNAITPAPLPREGRATFTLEVWCWRRRRSEGVDFTSLHLTLDVATLGRGDPLALMAAEGRRWLHKIGRGELAWPEGEGVIADDTGEVLRLLRPALIEAPALAFPIRNDTGSTALLRAVEEFEDERDEPSE